ncbi:MAG TPA: methyltransferase [Pyrinomonadaceae bacterium]|nr:methyltransferase [Pyrinomonadaceae bacterium]
MSATATPKEIPPPLQMLQLMSGFWISRCVYIIAKLGIADLLKEGPKNAAELASASGAHAPSLFRVLRALAAVDVLTQSDDNRFGNTPMSETLCEGPASLRWFAMTELGEEHYPAWGELMHSVRTGEIAFDKGFGEPVWEFFGKNPENARIFNNAMTGMTAQAEQALHAAYKFESIRTIMDVGGGHGGFITSILERNPAMRGILFDSPQVVEGAQPKLEAAGMADRCQVIGGNFFESVPEGADAITMKWIIHDWNDDQSIVIMRNCHRALPASGKLILVEAVVPPGDEMHFAKFIDLNMLVMTGGKERTAEEFRQLYEASGFKLTRIVPTESPFSVIEGVKA